MQQEDRTQREIGEALESLGGLVSFAGGRGDEALDAVKNALAGRNRYRDALEYIASLDPRPGYVEHAFEEAQALASEALR